MIDRGYLGNPLLKGAGVPIHFTPDQVSEWLKCADDPIYFIENYVKIVTLDDGLKLMTLFEYQKDIVRSLWQNRFSLGILPRQSGKTTCVAAFFTWYVIFNRDKTCAILANKAATAREILSRVQKAFEYLPKWLQHGVVEWNKGSFVLENGSRIIAASTSSSAIRGFSINCVTGDTMITICDDFDNIFHLDIEKAKANFPKYSIEGGTGLEKKFLIYRTTNKINGKEYIGFHSTTDIEDGYLGSGKLLKKAIEKYGVENFAREIIAEFDNREEAENLERVLVNREYVERDDTYNLSIGGNVCILFGENNGFFGKTHSDVSRQKISEAQRGKANGTGTKIDINGIEYPSKFAAARDGVYSNFSDTNLVNGEWSYVDPIIQSRELTRAKERIEYAREIISEKMSDRWQNVDREFLSREWESNGRNARVSIGVSRYIEENRDEFDSRMLKINTNPEKIRKTAEKHRGMKRSEETRRRQSAKKRAYLEGIGGSPLNKGKIHYHDPSTGKSIQISKDDIPPEGWVRGTGKKVVDRGRWYNNGKEVRAFKESESIPEGWVLGRIINANPD